MSVLRYRCQKCREPLGLLDREDAARFPNGCRCGSCGAWNSAGYLAIESDSYDEEKDADVEREGDDADFEDEEDDE